MAFTLMMSSQPCCLRRSMTRALLPGMPPPPGLSVVKSGLSATMRSCSANTNTRQPLRQPRQTDRCSMRTPHKCAPCVMRARDPQQLECVINKPHACAKRASCAHLPEHVVAAGVDDHHHCSGNPSTTVRHKLDGVSVGQRAAAWHVPHGIPVHEALHTAGARQGTHHSVWIGHWLATASHSPSRSGGFEHSQVTHSWPVRRLDVLPQ